MKTLWKLLATSSAIVFLLVHTAMLAELSQLKVLWVGDINSPRAGAFKGFLGKKVDKVELANRKGFVAQQAESFDVVLLDWPQGGPDRDFPPKSCPLGERDVWSKPTVLLGSAGLHVAITWKGRGGSG